MVLFFQFMSENGMYTFWEENGAIILRIGSTFAFISSSMEEAVLYKRCEMSSNSFCAGELRQN